MSVLNGVLEKGRCRTAWSCYLAVQHTICNAIKVVVLLGQQTGAIILSVGEFPSGTWQAGSVSWIQRMMEQVIESSVTKPGPALGAPWKTPHNHLRQLLPRNFSLFLNSCVCSLMPTKYSWLKALCLMLKEGRKAMALDLRVLVPAFFFFFCQHQGYWRTRLHNVILHVTVLLAIHFSASLGTSRTAVLPLCTSISMPA